MIKKMLFAKKFKFLNISLFVWLLFFLSSAFLIYAALNYFKKEYTHSLPLELKDVSEAQKNKLLEIENITNQKEIKVLSQHVTSPFNLSKNTFLEQKLSDKNPISEDKFKQEYKVSLDRKVEFTNDVEFKCKDISIWLSDGDNQAIEYLNESQQPNLIKHNWENNFNDSFLFVRITRANNKVRQTQQNQEFEGQDNKLKLTITCPCKYDDIQNFLDKHPDLNKYSNNLKYHIKFTITADEDASIKG